ncbi:tRNA pseudouridine synthase-like 1 isoform X3 [Melospiza georgiana]|uniref:tRNA pseudouridine synthase-like 1 isoform X3 n=1 Tax=Melospiza georgiana TaxID=44398 RepID=UPI0025ABE91D|nr:tRNA pseudouridine synthase-like 1 isoform X3 [Melospiza georgiana]
MAGAPARYLVFFQYFGTRYSGVMETKSDQALVGVQNYLEKAAEQLKPSAPIKFHISSRTDSGVHALANAAHLDIQRAPGRAPFTGPQLLHGLNHFLKPEPIRILSAQRVSSTFHARFCALSRTYVYRLLLGCAHRSQIPVFEQDLCWAPPGGPLDIPAMRAAAQLLLGTHDFSTFRSPRPEAAAQSPVRTLQLLQLQPGHGLLGQHHLHRCGGWWGPWWPWARAGWPRGSCSSCWSSGTPGRCPRTPRPRPRGSSCTAWSTARQIWPLQVPQQKRSSVD